MKQACITITHIIKKANANLEVLSNYRLISILSFMSKLVERAVSEQLRSYLCDNDLYLKHQPAYRACSSTETALLKTQNDLLGTLDDHKEAAPFQHG